MSAIKRAPLIEWDTSSDWLGSTNLLLELLWLARRGQWVWARNRRPLILGGGRLWYDGPIWSLHLGWVSVSLSVQ